MPHTAKDQLDALAEETLERLLARDAYAAISAGRKITRFPRGDLAEAEGVAAAAHESLDRLKKVDPSGLDRTRKLTAAYLRHMLELDVEEPARWWTAFPMAPYTSGALSAVPKMVFGPIDLTDACEADRYLTLANEFADHVEAMHERVEAQARRGWRMPKPALPNTRKTFRGIAAMAVAAIRLSSGRAASDQMRAAVTALVEDRLEPAYNRLLEAIGADYEAAAPELSGLMHQPGGSDAYRLWLRYHLGHEIHPAELHQVGLDQIAELAAEMDRVRIEQFDHKGDEASFHEQLAKDPKAKAPSAEALEGVYRRHLDHMAPVFARMFRKAPVAKPLLRRLPSDLEAGMTFGYYDPPKQIGADGVYFYSGNGIPDRMQMNAAALIFHELVPGHHVQIARQQENAGLPPLRRNMFGFTAFLEGWAEYAASLGEEAGLYEDPYDYYGYLLHQRFAAQRLVVDTGLNALGWTIDQAQAYMSANTLEKPEQVTSEILRYATDMPAQALCYRWGFLKFRELRAKSEERLGDRFVLADFHEAILDQGCLPMPVLEQSLNDWTLSKING